nr:MAG TPA: YopX protein [Caudoviricetes sp.]
MDIPGYRAWVYDPKLKERVMKEVVKLSFYLDTFSIATVFTKATVQTRPTEVVFDAYDIKDVILMKDTGLRDKDNIRIYERDILCFPNGCLGVVYWNQRYGRYEIECRGDIPKGLTEVVAKACYVDGNTLETKNLEDLLEENSWN